MLRLLGSLLETGAYHIKDVIIGTLPRTQDFAIGKAKDNSRFSL